MMNGANHQKMIKTKKGRKKVTDRRDTKASVVLLISQMHPLYLVVPEASLLPRPVGPRMSERLTVRHSTWQVGSSLSLEIRQECCRQMPGVRPLETRGGYESQHSGGAPAPFPY